MNKNALIILIRNPQLGRVKTRLAAKIGNEGALKVYEALLDYTKTMVSDVKSSKLLFYSDFVDNTDFWENHQFKKYLQQGNSFGSRMHNAFKLALKEHENAVIIGSDCEELTATIINQAFDNLSECDVVLGPAKDGGYYLMGLKKIYPELFTNKQWSTASVLKDTLDDVKALGLNFSLLPVLSDIDDFEDFKNSKLSKTIFLE